MLIKVDDIGNIYAELDGLKDVPPIIIGSHLDRVKKGGRFDGVLRVTAGLEVVRTLVENNLKPRIPLMIVNFTNEEGARFEPSMMASVRAWGTDYGSCRKWRCPSMKITIICCERGKKSFIRVMKDQSLP